ncbi:MAG: hypothetical protein ACFE7E_07260 [Candidatus Hodarchaeota archaeon]
MSVKEKPRKKIKKPPKEKIDKEKKIKEELKELREEVETMVKADGVETIEETKTVQDSLEKQIPKAVAEEISLELEKIYNLYEWVANPENVRWMYWMPSDKEHIDSWRSEWADFLFQWSRAKILHIVTLVLLMGEHPFDKLSPKVDALREIMKTLVEKDLAKFLDDKETRLRIYWRTLNEWAEIIYNWALNTGRMDITVFDIINDKKEKWGFHTLPAKEIRLIFGIMVGRGLARWMDEKRGHIEIKVDI